MQTNSVLSKQWASRPDDQRFLTVEDLHAAVTARRERSTETGAALEHLRVIPTDDGDLTLNAASGERFGRLTNWSMGQLCARAKAPAGFLRTLPAQMAAPVLQWTMEHTADREDCKILGWKHSRTLAPISAAVTSPSYGRIWDAEVTGAIRDRIDPTVWKVPGASYAAADPKRATTLYASDRDIFLFLCNEEHAIEVPGEGPKFRGFYVWNSEVGGGKFGLATMLYDRVCDNRIIWGVAEFREITIRHTAGAPMRFVAQAAPTLRKYLEASVTGETETIKNAQNKIMGKDRDGVVDWLESRGFGQKVAGSAYDAAEKEGIRNPRSLWGIVSGLTEVAHEITHTDARVKLERDASALLDLATAF